MTTDIHWTPGQPPGPGQYLFLFSHIRSAALSRWNEGALGSEKISHHAKIPDDDEWSSHENIAWDEGQVLFKKGKSLWLQGLSHNPSPGWKDLSEFDGPAPPYLWIQVRRP